MNRALVHWLLRMYPAAWRQRYGEELEELMRTDPGGIRTIVDILRSALHERWSSPTRTCVVVRECPDSILALSRQPSAFLPMAMSIAALSVVLIAIAGFGFPSPHADEGAAAHIWQLLMMCQVPDMVWFAFKWLRKAPRLTFGVLGIQLALALAALAPVYILGI